MRSAEVAACPRDWTPCVPRSVIIATGSTAGDAAPAIGGLTTSEKMRALAAIDERKRDLIKAVMVTSLMRMAQSNTPTHPLHAVTARSSMHVKHVTYQRAFPLKSGVPAVCLRKDPNRPLYRLCVAAL